MGRVGRMTTIPLSAAYRCKNSGKYVAIVDDEDFAFVSQWNWMANVRRSSKSPAYVRARRTDRSAGPAATVDMHVAIWERAFGAVPIGLTVDHIEHGSYGALDNRRANLRLATRKDQQGNRRKRASSANFKGVVRDQKLERWHAYITIDARTVNLGGFNSEVDAAVAYDRAAVKHFGVFAKLNFPDRQAA